MKWQVTLSKKTLKTIERLPVRVKRALSLLIAEIKINGPVWGDWPNYSKLKDQKHHCHLKKGQPTYVAVWQVIDNRIRLIEVIYAGTHEKAPY